MGCSSDRRAWRALPALVLGVASAAAQNHTAIWTGSEMIAWGGYPGSNEGLRYDPLTATSRPTSTGPNVPSPRSYHTAVWTGSAMIVWGGLGGGYHDTGGRYDPATDTWLPTSTGAGTPSARWKHAAVWTGTEMIVWGGGDQFGSVEGGRYDPASDTWTPTSTVNVPAPRHENVAVWTGVEMIVWGGDPATDGGRYDPVTDVWRNIATTGQPSPRAGFVGVWSGTELIVWGGSGYQDTGGRYDPAADAWRPMQPGGSTVAGRQWHTGIWAGTEMIVWGGYRSIALDSGGVYDPASDSWRSTSRVDAPFPAAWPAAVWDGVEMIVLEMMNFWRPIRRYDPAADRWSYGARGGTDGHLIAGKTNSIASPGASVRAYRPDGTLALQIPDAYASLPGAGVRIAGGSVRPGPPDEIVTAPGTGPTHPPLLRAFDALGAPLSGFSYNAYGTGGYGASVAVGAIDGNEETLSGPGPSATFGPHVRGFAYTTVVTPLPKVSFFAYGTLRYGANVAAADVDRDGFDEIVTGAGAGAVFGPHVRGFDYDGQAVAVRAGINFYAYGSLRYGVEPAGGDVDGDGYGEIVTGPGPSGALPAHLRGFDVDGAAARAIPAINTSVFGGAYYGLNVATSHLDTDADAEILVGVGPDPIYGSRTRAFTFGGQVLQEIPALALDVFATTYGVRVAGATLLP